MVGSSSGSQLLPILSIVERISPSNGVSLPIRSPVGRLFPQLIEILTFNIKLFKYKQVKKYTGYD